jgi:hypothetical protein
MPSAAKTIRLTERDLAAFRWLAEMKAIHEDDLAVLLGRMGDREPLSMPTTRALVDRWRRHGLVEARKVLMERPRVVTLRAAGAAAVSDEPGGWHEVAAWTAIHTGEVAHVRLALERHPRYGGMVAEWTSERRLRKAVQDGRRKGEGTPHIPDGMVTGTDGQRWAIEVERTPKETARLVQIIRTLTTAYDLTLYATRDKRIAAHVERCYEAVLSKPSGLRTNPLAVWEYPAEVTG